MFFINFFTKMGKIKKYFPHLLLIIYIALFIVCAIHPKYFDVWVAENIPVVIVVLFLVFSFKFWRFSNLSYFFMSLWVFMHTIGWHYSFEFVPFDFVNNIFWWERNMYDRIAHFIIWLYAFPMMEYLWESWKVKDRWLLYTCWIAFMLAIAWAYEIFEWQYAIMADPKAWLAVLGSQGDIWDAQKDMTLDTLGAVLSVIIFHIINFKYFSSKPWA